MMYAELVCQSNFSFLTGASHPEELVSQANSLGYHSLALTDECSVAGVVKAFQHIKENKLAIKLIVGSFFKLDSGAQFVLLCPNRLAYAELCRVISNARKRAKKGQYQLALWDLKSIKHCLILWLPKGSLEDDENAKWLVKYHKTRLWLAIKRHLKAGETRYITHCQQLSEQFKIPIVACSHVLMHHRERFPLLHAITAIRIRKSIDEAGFALASNAEASLRSLSKLTQLYPNSWIEQSIAIATLCQFDLAQLRYEYPQELVPQGLSAITYLRQLVTKGIAVRFPNGLSDAIKKTIEKELTLIEELEYEYFFLTIHDIVMFAKDSGILYQGRGSAANSIVCYCLEITSVDPRQISVLFERFISRERNEPPDIDVDFEHHRREEVIQYIYQKYGRERAALAATVITYRLKSAIRDIGKSLGICQTQLEFFIKRINRRNQDVPWQTQVVQLGLAGESAKGRQFLQLVEQILGFPRHLSQHVGGFVISSGPLYELVPVENAAMAERTIIQWDKTDLESLGLLKVDILALGMLSAIRKCFQLIKCNHQRTLNIADITALDDDEKVYSMMQQADTVGVFQIESRAQMSMLPRLKPACYYDLVIQIAIVRPGPIQGNMVHPFLLRRAKEQAVSYPSEAVKSILERTLGVPIFQEQVIKIAMVAAGFSGGEADQLRRAMAAWNKTGELYKFKTKLLQGMQTRGYNTAFAEQLYNQIRGFGEYGFPESHSASFAVLAYVSAWLKYYYPVEFYTSLLNSLPMGFYSASQLVQDAQQHQVCVLPVCVNASVFDHCVVKVNERACIRLGFRQVKGVQHDAIEQLLAVRPLKGFTSIAEVKRRVQSQPLCHQLASSGAFACLSDNRFDSRWQMMNQEHHLPLFEPLSEDQHHTMIPSSFDNMLEDYASLGLSLDHHPIRLLDDAGLLPRFTRASHLNQHENRSLITVLGLVVGKQSPGTASGVTFITLEDDTGNVNTIVWSATAKAQQQTYLTSKVLLVKGMVEKANGVAHVIAGKLVDLSDKLQGVNVTSRSFR